MKAECFIWDNNESKLVPVEAEFCRGYLCAMSPKQIEVRVLEFEGELLVKHIDLENIRIHLVVQAMMMW